MNRSYSQHLEAFLLPLLSFANDLLPQEGVGYAVASEPSVSAKSVHSSTSLTSRNKQEKDEEVPSSSASRTSNSRRSSESSLKSQATSQAEEPYPSFLKEGHPFLHPFSHQKQEQKEEEEEAHFWIRETDLTVVGLLEKEKEKQDILLSGDEKEAMTQKITDIRRRLHVLLKKNKEAESIERLEEEEFMIDEELKQRVLDRNESLRERLEHAIHLDCTRKELIRLRVAHQCYFTQEEHEKKLYPLKEEMFEESNSRSIDVYTADRTCLLNFVIPKLTEKEEKELKWAKKLRLAELMSMKRRILARKGFHGSRKDGFSMWPHFQREVSDKVSWILDQGSDAPSVDLKAKLALEKERMELLMDKEVIDGVDGSKKEEEEEEEEEEEGSHFQSQEEKEQLEKGMSEDNVFSLLYPPSCVRTNVQRNIQRILLKEIIRQIQREENKAFEALLARKENTIAQVEAKNDRIKEILSDLKLSHKLLAEHGTEEETKEFLESTEALELECEDELHQLFQPSLEREEKGIDALLEVKEEELLSESYETEEMRLRREREEEEKRRREEEARKGNSGERGLRDMMDGTLEMKKEGLTQLLELQKPDWMEHIAYEDMDEDQQRLFQEHEKKMKEFREEQKKLKKTLQQELKKTKAEVTELVQGFDKQLKTSIDHRQAVCFHLASQELYMAKLSSFSSQRFEKVSMAEKLEVSILELRGQLLTVQEAVSRYQDRMDDMKLRLNDVVEEDKNKEKTFKKNLQQLSETPLDQDTVKLYFSLFKLREKPPMPYGEESTGSYTAENEEMGAAQQYQPHRRGSGAGRRSFRGSRDQRRSFQSIQEMGKNLEMEGKMAYESSFGHQQVLQRAMELSRLSKDDPFYYIDDKEYKQKMEKGRQESEAFFPLDLERDAPEGFLPDESLWSALQRLRREKIESEQSIEHLQESLQAIRVDFDRLRRDESALSEQLDEYQDERNQLLQTIEQEDRDLELVVSLLQGQVEETTHGVASNASKKKKNGEEEEEEDDDSSELILIPNTILQYFNRCIHSLGDEKLAAMNMIREFRRGLNLKSWEATYKELQKKNISEKIVDLQLMRVTKNLQEIIDGAYSEDKVEQRQRRARKRLEMMEERFNEKIERMKAEILFLEKDNEEKLSENDHLKDELEDKRNELMVREAIFNSKKQSQAVSGFGGTSGDPVSQARMRMQRISMQRKLAGLSKTQQDEIDYLTSSLSRLRERTFPSFANATRERSHINPDEV